MPTAELQNMPEISKIMRKGNILYNMTFKSWCASYEVITGEIHDG